MKDSSQNNGSASFNFDDLELLTDQDLCKLFKTSPSSLYNWRKKNAIPHIKIENSVYYLKSQIYAWLTHQGEMSMTKVRLYNRSKKKKGEKK